MHEIERFIAEADDGTVYEIIVYGSRVDSSSHDGSSAIDSLGETWTSCGSRVNTRADGTFQIVNTGEIVRKIA